MCGLARSMEVRLLFQALYSPSPFRDVLAVETNKVMITLKKGTGVVPIVR